MKQKYDVAAYVWPSYTGDEKRARIFWSEGYGEWQTVKNAKENNDFITKPPISTAFFIFLLTFCLKPHII